MKEWTDKAFFFFLKKAFCNTQAIPFNKIVHVEIIIFKKKQKAFSSVWKAPNWNNERAMWKSLTEFPCNLQK